MTGEFKPDAIMRLLASSENTRALPTHADIQIPLSGIKYLRSLAVFQVSGQSLHATTGNIAGISALSAPIDLTTLDRATPLVFHLEFDVAGSNSLHFLPLGAQTDVSAQVAWPHPDFDGAFLPVSHERDAHGYSANWRVLELNRALPQMWRGTWVSNASLLDTAFGFRLFQPSDIYTQNYRAVRYGITRFAGPAQTIAASVPRSLALAIRAKIGKREFSRYRVQIIILQV